MSALDDSVSTGREIAVIGMSGRFPKAKDLTAYWANLKNGVEAVTRFSDEELAAAAVAPGVLNDPNYVKAGSLLEDPESFDASFFGYNPREAEILDPQQRLFLEQAWWALEDAGYAPGTYPGLIGIYAGVAWNTYLLSNLATNRDLFDAGSLFQIFIANDKDFMPTRVSYKLNLKGPSLIVQTSCSTSLVAIHLACLSLLNYECDLALAGGVTLKVPQASGYYYFEGGLGSPDGHCRTFDAKGQGTIFGSGVGIVALKRLAEALADGDSIYAVIKGSAINNDGSLKVSYTAPSVEGQAEVIAAAQAVAGVEPDTINYIEAHGTATALGDPIEVTALTKVFRARTPKKNFCAIGSVKSNFGHLDAAAGVAGFIKTALALHHKYIPPSLNFETPNPKIDFESSPFYVNTALADWPRNGTPRRAGVSSFGVGGTNAHLILEEAPEREPSSASRPWQLLLLSAKTGTALETATANLAEHLTQDPQLNLADVAYTLQTGRAVFRHRRMLVCQDPAGAVTELREPNSGRVLSATDTQDPRDRSVAFMFTGQGAQYVNMARELYETEPTFRQHLDHCAELLQPHLEIRSAGLPMPDLPPEGRWAARRSPRSHGRLKPALQEALYPEAQHAAEAAELLDQTWLTQPALFAVEYALAQLWLTWGVKPQALIGHSVGEYVAACLAGVFSLEDALALVAARGRLMQSLPGGSMLAVALPEQEVNRLLNAELSLAAVNGPAACVVSGPGEAIDQLEQQLTGQGVTCRRLHTSHAFHSAMMEPILDAFAQEVKRVTLQSPQAPYISNVTGTWITPAEATDPAYWVRQLRQPVRFAAGLQELLSDPERVLLEVGPGRTLSTLAKQSLDQTTERVVLSSLRHARESEPDVAFVLNTLGQLWLAGVSIDWPGFYAHEGRHRLHLPAYPFERQRYWIEPASSTTKTLAQPVSAGKQADLANWFYLPAWEASLPKPPAPSADPRRWLIFMDDSGIGAQLAQQLAEAGHQVTPVTIGEEFGHVDPRSYKLDPRRPEAYQALLHDLHEQGRLPQVVVHLWGVTASRPTECAGEDFEAAQHLGFYSLLFLARALEKYSEAAPIHLEVVTSHMQQVAGEAVFHPEKATLLGLCKIIPQGFLNLTCRSVDIAPEDGRKLIVQLLAELTSPVTDGVVAYRNQQRWVQTFKPARVEANAGLAQRLRANGTYLLVDGLSGIGFILAEYLAQTVKAKLILIEPSFPERSEWEKWLADHSDADDVSLKIRNVQALEALGAETLVLNADVTDAGQLRAACVQGVDRFGALHGVIHAAGVVGERSFRAIQETGYAESQWHFGPKAHGAIALSQALQDHTPDFCLLASSLSSVLGGRGYAAYAAANLFLDAFVRRANQIHAFPWLSVNWDAWQTEPDQDTVAALNPELTQYAMSPAQVGEVFGRVLSLGPVQQVVVSTGNLAARLDQWVQHLAAARDRTPRHVAPGKLHPRPKLRTPYTAPGTELERSISKIWQGILGFEQIGVHDNFFELGGDSLIAIRLVAQLKDVLKIELPVARLYQGLTVEALAQIIEQNGQAGQRQAEQQAERKEKMSQRKQYQSARRSTKQNRGAR